jgi:hypothetical protein
LPFSTTATELTVAFPAVTWMVASRPTPVVPSAGVTVSEGGPATVSCPLGVEVGRGLGVALGEAVGARLHPVIAIATAPRVSAHPRRRTDERVVRVRVRRSGRTTSWFEMASDLTGCAALWERPASLG